MYSTREETSSFWRSSATILVNRSSSWIPCYTGPVMMEAFYNRFWINNGLAIDRQAAYKTAGNKLPTNYQSGKIVQKEKAQRYLSQRARKWARKVLRKGNPMAKSGKIVPPDRLSDSLGAWNMSDEEEERIVSSLKKYWKKTTLAIRAAEEKPPEDDQDVDKLVKSLLKLKRTGKEPLILRLNKPATAVVASGRDRWH